MSLAAVVFDPIERQDNRRWMASFATVLMLHAVAVAFLFRLNQSDLLHPPAAAPAMTFIDLAPLPTPPTPVLPAPAPPPPEAQTPPAPVPPPVPLAMPKRIVPHRVVPPQPVAQPQPPTPEVETSPPPRPALAAPTAPTVDHAVPRFTDLIAAQLERYKRYPATAQRRGEQGIALLRFTLDRGGNVSNARIERSSGHADLDDEVLALLRRAEPLPAIPAEIASATLDIAVPVNFALR